MDVPMQKWTSPIPRAILGADMSETKQNPLTAGTPQALLPRPCVLVIFGAAGDLTWRKLLPAIYNLNADGELPSNFAVVGFGTGSQGDPDEWIRETRPRRN